MFDRNVNFVLMVFGEKLFCFSSMETCSESILTFQMIKDGSTYRSTISHWSTRPRVAGVLNVLQIIFFPFWTFSLLKRNKNSLFDALLCTMYSITSEFYMYKHSVPKCKHPINTLNSSLHFWSVADPGFSLGGTYHTGLGSGCSFIKLAKNCMKSRKNWSLGDAP